jgi:hypothetical protein
MSEFSRPAGYKASMKKIIVFLYSSNKNWNWNKKWTPFPLVSRAWKPRDKFNEIRFENWKIIDKVNLRKSK